MDKAKIVLYAHGDMVKQSNGVNYDRQPVAIISIFRDISYEQLSDRICNRLKINKTTHQIKLLQRVAIGDGNLYYDVVPIEDDEAVQELVNTQGLIAVYVEMSKKVLSAVDASDFGQNFYCRGNDASQTIQYRGVPKTQEVGSSQFQPFSSEQSEAIIPPALDIKSMKGPEGIKGKGSSSSQVAVMALKPQPKQSPAPKQQKLRQQQTQSNEPAQAKEHEVIVIEPTRAAEEEDEEEEVEGLKRRKKDEAPVVEKTPTSHTIPNIGSPSVGESTNIKEETLLITTRPGEKEKYPHNVALQKSILKIYESILHKEEEMRTKQLEELSTLQEAMYTVGHAQVEALHALVPILDNLQQFESLQAETVCLQATVSQQQEVIAKKDKDYEKLTMEKDELQTRMSEWVTKFQIIDASNQNLHTQISMLEEGKKQLELERGKLKLEIQDLRVGNDQLKKKIDHLIEDAKKQEACVNKLMEQLHKKNFELDSLRKEFDKCKSNKMVDDDTFNQCISKFFKTPTWFDIQQDLSIKTGRVIREEMLEAHLDLKDKFECVSWRIDRLTSEEKKALAAAGKDIPPDPINPKEAQVQEGKITKVVEESRTKGVEVTQTEQVTPKAVTKKKVNAQGQAQEGSAKDPSRLPQ